MGGIERGKVGWGEVKDGSDRAMRQGSCRQSESYGKEFLRAYDERKGGTLVKNEFRKGLRVLMGPINKVWKMYEFKKGLL